MFGIFKKNKKKADEAAPLTREEIIAEAKKNAAKARAELGDENIQKLAEAIRRMDDPDYQSEGKKAREAIRQMDSGHVADNIKATIKEK